MKIIVTGGAGFIASHVVDQYLQLGHDVCVVDNLSRGTKNNVNPRARFYQGDILDRAFIDGIFAQEKPDVVNHHAAQMDVRRGVSEPLFDARVNILGSLNLIESAVAHHVQRFIYISTGGAAYGDPKEIPVPENYPLNPITPYGISKHTVEHYLYTFSFLYRLPYVVLRYGNVYGPRQSSQGEAGVFAVFCEQMIGSVQSVIYGDGSKVRDYIYVDDVTRANVAALEKGTGEIFNIATGIPTTDYEVFCVIRDLLGKAQVEPQFVARRPGEVDKIYLDVSKARRLLEWSPQTTMYQGACMTVKYFQQSIAMRQIQLEAGAPVTVARKN